MHLDEFETVFRDSGMRVLLAWDFLRGVDTEINEIYSRSTEALGQLYTVWYATPDELNGDWHNPSDRPLRVAEATQTFDTWPEARVRQIAHFSAQFEKVSHPVQLTLPAYAPNSRDAILLDGTHRAVAAYQAKKEVRLIVFALRGPCDPRILPDLAHHSP